MSALGLGRFKTFRQKRFKLRETVNEPFFDFDYVRIAVHAGLPRKRDLISADGHLLFHRPPQSGRVCANTKYLLSKVQKWRILMHRFAGP